MDESGDHQRQPKTSGGNAWPRAGWPMGGGRGKSLTAQHMALQLLHKNVCLRGCRRFAKAFEQQPLAVSTFVRENFRKWSRDQTVPCFLKKSIRAPTPTCSANTAADSSGLEGKKKNHSRLAVDYMQKGV